MADCKSNLDSWALCLLMGGCLFQAAAHLPPLPRSHLPSVRPLLGRGQDPGEHWAGGRAQGSLGHLVATWHPPKCRVWCFHLPVCPKDAFMLLFDLGRTLSTSWQSCLTHKNNISLVLLKMQSKKKESRKKLKSVEIINTEQSWQQLSLHLVKYVID